MEQKLFGGTCKLLSIVHTYQAGTYCYCTKYYYSRNTIWMLRDDAKNNARPAIMLLENVKETYASHGISYFEEFLDDFACMTLAFLMEHKEEVKI